MRNSKRLRVFSGPNGSGKSTIYNAVKEYFNEIPFVNADIIESKLLNDGFVNLLDFQIKIDRRLLTSFKNSDTAKSLFEKNTALRNQVNHLEIVNNILIFNGSEISGYLAAYCSSFIRAVLIKKEKSFSFETVMSHISKIEELKLAKSLGYKVYQYFVCTDSPLINISRVEDRKIKGGHDVSKNKIESRYYKTLENLLPSIKHCYRVYFFDTSSKNKLELFAELYQDKLEIHSDNIPNWFYHYVLNPIYKL
jgi:predicted ABC-type ATPase